MNAATNTEPIKNKVLISILGQRDDEDEPIALMTDGIYTEDNGVVSLEYDESALSGMEGTTLITLKAGEVSLERKGEAHSFLLFSKHQRSESTYATTEATFSLTVYTTLLEYKLSPDDGWLELEYNIEMSGVSATNRLSLEYRSQEKAALN